SLGKLPILSFYFFVGFEGLGRIIGRFVNQCQLHEIKGGSKAVRIRVGRFPVLFNGLVVLLQFVVCVPDQSNGLHAGDLVLGAVVRQVIDGFLELALFQVNDSGVEISQIGRFGAVVFFDDGKEAFVIAVAVQRFVQGIV